MATRKPQTKEEVLGQTIKDIRQKFGEGAIMRMGDKVAIQTEVLPTGVLPLDCALGVGGLPKGRITEIYGAEGTGKTTLALHTIASAQKAGGTAAFIDAEHALDPRMAATIGVDVDNLYVAQPDSGERALAIAEYLVHSGAVDIIVIDSVAALTPMQEINGELGDATVGLQARMMSYALRRLAGPIAQSNCIVIFINQLRATINTGYSRGPSETTTGGRALKFYTSVRIEVKRGRAIPKGEETIGHELFFKVVKNKVAAPFRTAHCSLIYGRGIPDDMSVLDMAIDYGVLTRNGSWMVYNGETIAQGKEKTAAYLDAHPELKEELRAAVLAKAAESSGYEVQPPVEEVKEDPAAMDLSDELIEINIDDE